MRLTRGLEGGGTELIRFDTTNPTSSPFKQARITAVGEDPSLFLDDDNTFYWVMGAGQIAPMHANPWTSASIHPSSRTTTAPSTTSGPRPGQSPPSPTPVNTAATDRILVQNVAE